MAKRQINHILVLADGSDAGFRAAEIAVALARDLGVKLTVMSVIDTETLRQLLTYRILANQEMSDFEAELETSSRGHLERVRNMAMEEKVVAEQVLVRGSYSNAVVNQQKQLGADLIVMAGFPSSRATRDLLAREYQKIADQAPCAILTAK